MSSLDRENSSNQSRFLALSADVGRALTTGRTLADMLMGCAEALVTHLDAAFARIWTLDTAQDILVLRASAGQYTHLDGPHGRIPVGQFKIGVIAQERRPHLTNAVIGDPRVSDQEWAVREGMVAFAGYPLVVEDRLVGVIALFARHPLDSVTLRSLGSVADQVAVGIERKDAEEAALEANRRTTRILESITDAFFALDGEWRFAYLNDQAENLLQRPRTDLLGKNVWSEFPAAVGTTFDRQYHRAMDEQTVVAFEEYYPPPLDKWFEVRAYPTPEGLSVYFHDITKQVSRRQRERFLADLAERARGMTDPDRVIADAIHSVGKFLGVSRCIFADIDIEADTCTIHPDYRANSTVASIEGVVPISAFGAFVVAEYAARRAVAVDDVRLDPVRAPAGSLAAYEAIGIRAHVTVPVVHSDRIVSCISVHNAAPRHWTPEEVELLRTVVERTWLTVEVTRQQRALAREAETTTRILESITDAFFTLDHQWRFTHVNHETERALFKSRSELLGRYVWEVFPEGEGSTFDQQYRRAVADGVAVSFEEFYPPLGAWLEVRAYPFDDGLSVFFQNVNTRKAAQNERERLLAEQRARAEREALLNRIGLALRGSPDPERVLETAVRELGEALKADRCYFAAYNQDADTATVGPDWQRGGRQSIAGQYRMSRFAINRDPVYRAGHTQVLADTSEDPAALELGLRALVRVPLASGTTMTALSVAMTDSPRSWTTEEVSLVEAVATQTHTALEAALVSRKEHTIAQQLQDALQPAVPDHVLGLSVGSFTQPALEEASVGGDFFDLFPLDKELYALVIGDVSGKGLAAAQQIALIRNSLRTTLYLYRAPAQAAASLNAIVTSHDLLIGFVTAWVGVYDAATGRITYCSCGHEPGLIRRADGTVEEMATTGPPLGVAENAEYSQEVLTLSSADSLLLYTDGISEAGPNRRKLLGTEGLMGLLRATPAAGNAQMEADALVEAVSAAVGGVFRDDVAVLLVRRL